MEHHVKHTLAFSPHFCGAILKLAEVLFPESRNRDRGVFKAVINERRPSRRMQRVDHGRTVAKKRERFVWIALAHGLGSVPVAAGTVEIPAPNENASLQ